MLYEKLNEISVPDYDDKNHAFDRMKPADNSEFSLDRFHCCLLKSLKYIHYVTTLKDSTVTPEPRGTSTTNNVGLFSFTFS